MQMTQLLLGQLPRRGLAASLLFRMATSLDRPFESLLEVHARPSNTACDFDEIERRRDGELSARTHLRPALRFYEGLNAVATSHRGHRALSQLQVQGETCIASSTNPLITTSFIFNPLRFITGLAIHVDEYRNQRHCGTRFAFDGSP